MRNISKSTETFIHVLTEDSLYLVVVEMAFETCLISARVMNPSSALNV